MQLLNVWSCIIWKDIVTAVLLKSNELPSPYGIQGQIHGQNNSILTDLDVSQLLCLLATKQVECTRESDADCKSYKYDIAQRVKFIPDWDALTLFIASCHLFYNFAGVSALFSMCNGREIIWNMLIYQIYWGFMLTWLVSKREIKLLMTKCFRQEAISSSQFDHLHYAKHSTASYFIQHPPDLVITFNCHIVGYSPLASYSVFSVLTMGNNFFSLCLFVFLFLSGGLFNNGQGLGFFIKALKYINHFTFVCGRRGRKGRKLCIKMIKLGLFELIIGIIGLSVNLKEKFRSIICTHYMFLFF